MLGCPCTHPGGFMRIGPFSFLILVLVVAAATVGPARADVPPPDLCTAPGQPCQNAGAITGPGHPGTCVATTCTKSVRGADGGLTPMTYDCNKCEAPDGGTAGGDGTAGAAGGTAGAGGGGGALAAGGTSGAAGASATGGTTGTGGTSATGGATGSAGKSGGGSSSGCTVAGSPGRPATTTVALSLGFLTILLARRRRRG
ncbi:MAG TPA: hypothetical protein VLT58_10440 [Polyangia bacterium]|nr:hypothetical protein [Polyangia bacterium]